jgi:hypothetical protein
LDFGLIALVAAALKKPQYREVPHGCGEPLLRQSLEYGVDGPFSVATAQMRICCSNAFDQFFQRVRESWPSSRKAGRSYAPLPNAQVTSHKAEDGHAEFVVGSSRHLSKPGAGVRLHDAKTMSCHGCVANGAPKMPLRCSRNGYAKRSNFG